eukprot:s2007_g16.t1
MPFCRKGSCFTRRRASAQQCSDQVPFTSALQDERVLRGLLQFFVCADARRSASEEVPLRLRYRDLVLTTYSASAMHEKIDAAKTSELLQATVDVEALEELGLMVLARGAMAATVAADCRPAGPECQYACGWTAFPGRSTCCRSCRGAAGPHAKDRD